jgi:N6-L-threonylcarbamoyladenine synthase
MHIHLLDAGHTFYTLPSQRRRAGGVVPNLAMEAHKAAIDSVVTTAMERAGVRLQDLDAIAVTVGPGLSLCLRVSAVS